MVAPTPEVCAGAERQSRALVESTDERNGGCSRKNPWLREFHPGQKRGTSFLASVSVNSDSVAKTIAVPASDPRATPNPRDR